MPSDYIDPSMVDAGFFDASLSYGGNHHQVTTPRNPRYNAISGDISDRFLAVQSLQQSLPSYEKPVKKSPSAQKLMAQSKLQEVRLAPCALHLAKGQLAPVLALIRKLLLDQVMSKYTSSNGSAFSAPSSEVNFASKMMNYVSKVMNFAFKGILHLK